MRRRLPCASIRIFEFIRLYPHQLGLHHLSVVTVMLIIFVVIGIVLFIDCRVITHPSTISWSLNPHSSIGWDVLIVLPSSLSLLVTVINAGCVWKLIRILLTTSDYLKWAYRSWIVLVFDFMQISQNLLKHGLLFLVISAIHELLSELVLKTLNLTLQFLDSSEFYRFFPLRFNVAPLIILRVY